MAKFDIKTVKPKFVVTTSPENKIDVVVSKPIIEAKNSKSFFQLKNTGGPRGLKGEQGEPGQDATIEVVSTTTGAAGTNASVVNQGTASAAQLAFTIPRGDTGAQGVPGYSPSASVSKSGDTATITITDQNGTTTASVKDGQNGAAGQAATIAVDSTSTLPAGSSATVTNVGTSSAARLAFGIPKGDTGAAGADGDAATIQVGQVETLAPNQPAYVNNVGTSSAAIFNIGIPKGDKGDAGAGTGDMLASTYDPNGDVASAGGIPAYVAGEIPTNTSDLNNDSDFTTNATLQKIASNMGTVVPNFEGMTPLKTFTWTVADTTYRPVYQMDNTDLAYDTMDVEVAYRITVTGTGISQVCDIVDRWHYPLGRPVTTAFNRTLSTDAGTTGFRYLRSVYPTSSGLNDNTYKIAQEIANYNSTSRTITVDVFKTDTKVTWNETKPAGSAYSSSTYQSTSSVTTYTTRGWIFASPGSFAATSATAASYVNGYEGYNVGASSTLKSGGALTSGYLAFLADDGLVYDISNTVKNMVADENGKIGLMTSSYAANKAIDYRYFRTAVLFNSTQAGYISHDAISLGSRLYLRCTRDASGNIHSDNYLATSMAAGYTWLPCGFATASTAFYFDARRPVFYTLDNNGKVTHINGKELAQPTVPTVNDATLTITQNGVTAGTFTANASSNNTIALTDTTYSDFTGATSLAAGSAGLVPAPTTSDPDKFLKGDGTWATPNAGGVFDCYVNKTLASSWTGYWDIYDNTSYTTTLDSANISTQLLAGKRVVVHTSDSSPYTFEIISQYDDSLPCYDFLVSFNGTLKKLHYIKLIGWEFTEDIVNDATLTIQHNGTTVDTFSANASANKTVNIETIWADDIEAATPAPSVETAMIADGAVTSAKIDQGTYSITDTPAHDWGTNSTSVTRVANIVVVSVAPIWVNGSAMTADTWLDIGQLPSSIYPSKEVATIGYTVNGNTGNFITATPAMITAAGKIRIKPPTVQSVLTGVYVFFVYTI